jgi:putative ABC transport system substrate-binding protein
VVGVLGIATAEGYALNIAAFMQALKEGGFIEARNVVIEQRWVNYQYDRLPEMAADLVRRRVAVILAVGTAEALAAKAATTNIPIVFAMGGDPVALGLVASLSRPGGNVTGIANLSGELNPKQLQLLRQLKPDAVAFGVLADPAFPSTQSLVADLNAGARALGQQLVFANASTDSDLEPAFATFSQQHVGAVLVGTSALYNRAQKNLPR